MITISQAVETIVNQRIFIVELLNDGLVNYSSLAKNIKPDVESLLNKKVNDGAIVMSLRRYVSVNKVQTTAKLEKMVRKLGDIIVRSNLADYTFKNSDTLLKKQQKLISLLSTKKDLFYTFSQGVYETTFVLSDIVSKEIPDIFNEERLISYNYGLSSITIKLPAENIDQPGLYYYIFKRIAWEGINVLEVISTTNEFTIILKDKDVDRAFSVIKRLK
ncbi:MAG: aspartate kinase [Bacteroidetes bacterium GWF2_33_16]|nr:MAG: aspartate kinase [Bacteroidetes bacterium GWE2_32_14]OFY05176.1 MAG: aspartate kinase [Bacteroidetes bacterium GWF2_33_16]